MSNNKITLITGSQGYIGSVLIPKLIERDYTVIGVDSGYFSDTDTLKFENTILKDIRNIKIEDLQGVDTIIHLAALSNDPMGALNPELTLEINFASSVNLAKLAKQVGVRKFIFSSSCSVYGSTDYIASESSKINPLTVYAKSKVLAEQEISQLATADFCPVFMRNATVYGASPNLRLDLAINNFVFSVYTAGVVKLLSTGTSKRPFIEINDLSRAFIAMLEADDHLVCNQVFNIGFNKDNYTIRILAAKIADLLEVPLMIADGAQADARNYEADFTKFAEYFPEFKFDDITLPAAISTLSNMIQLTKIVNCGIHKYSRLDQLNNLLSTKLIDHQLYWR